MLRNEVYTGLSEWGRQRTGLLAHRESDSVRTEDTHPPLVSREDFDAVQHLLGERTRERIHPRRLGSSYLLSGLLWCGHCQSPFIGHPAKGGEHHYYGCQRNRKAEPMQTGAAACPSKLLPQGEAELAVIDLLRREVLTPSRLAELTELVNADLSAASDTTTADLKAVAAQVADARGRLGRLYAALESEGRTTVALELNELAPRIREWKGKLDDLEIRRVSLVAKAEIKPRPVMDAATVTAYIRELSALLATGPLAARKAFLRSFIQRVDATGYDLSVTYTLPPLPEPGGGMPAAANEPGGEVPLRRAAGAEGADLRVGGGIDGLGSPDVEKAEARFPRVLPIGKNGSTRRSVHEPLWRVDQGLRVFIIVALRTRRKPEQNVGIVPPTPARPRTSVLARAREWEALIGRLPGVHNRADLAAHLGVSRARVTQALAPLAVSPRLLAAMDGAEGRGVFIANGVWRDLVRRSERDALALLEGLRAA